MKAKKKEYKIDRITYSSIYIKANSRKEAEDMIGDIDGDDDRWDYYDEEFFLLEDNGKGEFVNYDEYSQTHTAHRDNEEVDDEQRKSN